LGLIGVAAGIVVSGAAVADRREHASVYPLKRLSPAGFGVFKGVLDWVPVSETTAVAFAGDSEKATNEYSLASFTLSAAGVASPGRVIASGKGRPYEAACVWLDGGGAGPSPAAPFGYIFVLFEDYVSSTQTETAAVWMAKFDAQGQVSGEWAKVFEVKTPAGRSICGEWILASSRGDSIGVVPSLTYYGNKGVRKSLVYFVEIDGLKGTVIGAPSLLPLPQSGDYVEAYGYAPAWNGLAWLVPVEATLAKSPGGDAAIYGKKALVYAVASDAAHRAVARTIASDMTRGWSPYGDLWIVPYPGAANDSLLFLKKQKEIPAAQRKLDLYRYSFSLNTLDGTGSLVSKRTISVPALTHKLVYDPDAELDYPDDYWTPPVVKDGTLYLSRAHSTADFKKGTGRYDRGVSRYEQQYGLYAVGALTGAVTLVAQTATTVDKAFFMPPVLRVFPSDALSVVNTIWFYYGTYPRWSYFSMFPY
jgi:hypothetical protein